MKCDSQIKQQVGVRLRTLHFWDSLGMLLLLRSQINWSFLASCLPGLWVELEIGCFSFAYNCVFGIISKLFGKDYTNSIFYVACHLRLFVAICGFTFHFAWEFWNCFSRADILILRFIVIPDCQNQSHK